MRLKTMLLTSKHILKRTNNLNFNGMNYQKKALTKYNYFNFSTSFIKDLQIQQNMDHFQKTLTILNGMIERLQANTGGQYKKDLPKVCKVQQKKPAEVIQPKVQPQKQQSQKKPQAEKAKNKQKKEQKKPKDPANKQQKNKQKKQTQKKEPQQQGPKEIDPKFFSQIDIRIGEIVECWKHPESQNLYCQKINVGKQVREIASGLQKFVQHANMKGNVLVMVNLKPKPLAGFPSNGMVVCASTPDHTNVQLLIPDGQIGERVFLEGFQDLFTSGEFLPVLNPKRKVVEKSLQHFKTDAEGFVIWQGIRLRTKAEYIKAATINNGNVG